MTWKKRDGLWVPDDDQSKLCGITGAILAGGGGGVPQVERLRAPIYTSTQGYWPCSTANPGLSTVSHGGGLPDLSYPFNPTRTDSAHAGMVQAAGTFTVDKVSPHDGAKSSFKEYVMRNNVLIGRLQNLIGDLSLRIKVFIPGAAISLGGVNHNYLFGKTGATSFAVEAENAQFSLLLRTDGVDAGKLTYFHHRSFAPIITEEVTTSILMPLEKWFTLGISRTLVGPNTSMQWYMDGVALDAPFVSLAPTGGTSGFVFLSGIVSVLASAWVGSFQEACIDDVVLTAQQHLDYENAVMKAA